MDVNSSTGILLALPIHRLEACATPVMNNPALGVSNMPAGVKMKGMLLCDPPSARELAERAGPWRLAVFPWDGPRDRLPQSG